MSDSRYYDGSLEESKGLSIAKVYGYMFIGLLITAAIAIGLGLYFGNVLLANASTEMEARIQETNAIILLVVLGVSAIALLVLSIVVPIVAIRGKHSVLVPGILYCAFMGVMLSTFVIFIDWKILGLTFFITSLVFGLMSLIALLSKSRLNGLGIAAIGLFLGAGLISLTMWILMLMGFDVTPLYWIVSLATFAGTMLITIWDMARIKQIAEDGAMTRNTSLYCAFILYVDFIRIFLRLLRYILIIFGRKR